MSIIGFVVERTKEFEPVKNFMSFSGFRGG